MSIQPNKPVVSTAQQGLRILVTGGTGFLGSYIIRDLVQQGYSVRAIRRSAVLPSFISQDIWQAVEWIDSDILDIAGLETAMRDVHAVIHSAAVVSFNDTDREELYRTNVEGTANVVNTAIECGVKKFIHVSSVAALGRKNRGITVNEDQKWQDDKTNTHYAISKHQAEMEVWRGIAEGLPSVIVNPSTILGYGDWNSSSCAIFRNVYNGFPWYTNGINGFVDVEDVSKCIVMLLASPIHSERFIINAENRSYRDILNTIAGGFGKKAPHREATPRMAAIAWRLERLRSFFTGKRPLVTRESAKIARSDSRYDNRKILEALPGFQFTLLDETIKRSCNRYSTGNS